MHECAQTSRPPSTTIWQLRSEKALQSATFCRPSKPQLGATVGIDSMEVEAYEQGEKRMSWRLLLETAKQLKATPRFFFQ
jgi:hypothetical protein